MNILGIETSCDETSVAIVKDGIEVLGNIINSQVLIHEAHGGVVPEIASRNHLENMIPVIDEALKSANLTLGDIDGIGVTYGPGLIGALLVGVSSAKALAYALDLPLIGVNHLKGHLYGNILDQKEIKFPAIGLIISGGHTSLVLWKSHEEMVEIGRTRDDAAGEVYDKIARIMGLKYPGGPKVEKLSRGVQGDISFPLSLLESDSLDFSFSGLKSAVLNYINQKKMKNEDLDRENICASFQDAVFKMVSTKVLRACAKYNIKEVYIGGGVAANNMLKEYLVQELKKMDINFHAPSNIWTTDNGAMIGSSAYYEYLKGNLKDLSLNGTSRMEIM